ncbi:MAG: hypothetical protein V3U98_06000 [Acidobacteriota bacterium]
MNRSLVRLLMLSALALGFLLLVPACAEPDISELPLPETPEEVLAELTEARTRIDDRTEQVLERIRTWNETRQAGERKIYFAEIFEEALSAKEQGLLNELFEQEQNVSYRGLLSQIISDRDRIQEYQTRIARLEERLPRERDTIIVARGDTHYRLARRYLTESQGMSEEAANEAIQQINLDGEIVPGNKIWFYYAPDKNLFASWVHQGDARRGPLVVQWAKRRQLVSERDQAVAKVVSLEDRRTKLVEEVEGLEGAVAKLETRRSELETQIAGVITERDEHQEIARTRQDEISRINNSLFYHASTERDLKDRRVVKWFNRIKDIKGVQYDEYLDLRASKEITFEAADFGLNKISKVALLPKHFRPGVDYEVQIAANGDATVEILQPQVFRGQKVLFSIDD